MAVKNKSRRKKKMGGQGADLMKQLVEQHGETIAKHGKDLMHKAVATAIPLAFTAAHQMLTRKKTKAPKKYTEDDYIDNEDDYTDTDDEFEYEDEDEQYGGKKNKKYKKSRMTKKRKKTRKTRKYRR